MQIYNIYFSILNNPLAINNYRQLQDYYAKKGSLEESEAFRDLIETRKNDTIDHTNPSF
jgi:hypothetical protein